MVRVTGELDLAARDRLFLACTARHHLSIVVDVSALTFMDCCGYGGIVAARNVVEADGRTPDDARRTRPTRPLLGPDRASRTTTATFGRISHPVEMSGVGARAPRGKVRRHEDLDRTR